MKRLNYLFNILIVFIYFIMGGCVEDPSMKNNLIGAEKPSVTTGIVESKTATSVTLSGSVERENGSLVTEYGFVWHINGDEEQAKDSIKLNTNKQLFTSTIEALKDSTEYIVYAYAKNNVGLSYGEKRSFITFSGLGIVETLTPVDIKAGSAVCGGRVVVHGEGEENRRGIYYSKEPFVSAKEEDIFTQYSTMETDSFTCDLIGLEKETNYYVQAFVENQFGITKGEIVIFKTGNGQLLLNNPTKVDITTVFAEFQSKVLDDGDAPITLVGFCYNKESSFDIEKNDTIHCVINEDGVFTGKIENLLADTVYFVKAFAVNEYGTYYSQNSYRFFLENKYPTVTSNDPSLVDDAGGIRMSGYVEAEGMTAVAEAGICYSFVSDDPKLEDLNTEVKPVSSGIGFFSVLLENMKGESTCYMRAYATNSLGTNYGKVKSIQTPNVINQLESFPGSYLINGSAAYFVSDDNLYLFGGDKGDTSSNELWRYNPEDNAWREMRKPDDFKRSWTGTAAIKGGAFFFGGLNEENERTNDLYYYQIAFNTWSDDNVKSVIVPDSLSHVSGCTLSPRLYYAGGISRDVIVDEVWSFKYILGEWEQKTSLPEAQYNTVAVTVDNTIYIGLGKNSIFPFPGSSNRWWSTTDYAETWNEEIPLPEGMAVGAVVLNEYIYVVNDLGVIWKYNTIHKEWEKKKTLNATNRDIHCFAILNNIIYIGFGSNGDRFISYSPLWDN